MRGKNLWNKAVPRVEHDARAREMRLWLQRLERLLVHRLATTGLRPVRLWGRVFGLAMSLTVSSRDESTGSSSNRRPGGIPAAVRGCGGELYVGLT